MSVVAKDCGVSWHYCMCNSYVTVYIHTMYICTHIYNYNVNYLCTLCGSVDNAM